MCENRFICEHRFSEEYWVDQKQGIIGQRCLVCGEVLSTDKSTYPFDWENHMRGIKIKAARAKVARTNKRGQACYRCGGWVSPGEGELFFVHQEDEGLYGFQSGWLVRHLCIEDCEAAEKAAREDERIASQTAAKRSAEKKELIEAVSKMTGLKDTVDWSFDSIGYQTGKTILESEHYRAVEYLCFDELVGFVVEERK